MAAASAVERVVTSGVRPTSRGCGHNNYPVSGLRNRRERQRAAAVSARDDRPRERVSSIFGSDYNGLQLSAERRGSHVSGKAYLLPAAATKMSIFRAAGCRDPERDPAWRRTRSEFERSHAQLRPVGRLEVDYMKDAGVGPCACWSGTDRLRDRVPAVRGSRSPSALARIAIWTASPTIEPICRQLPSSIAAALE